MNFNPQRLTFARKRRGFTKKALARKLEVNCRTITAYESKEHFPSKEMIRKISLILKFPEKFFFEDDIEVPDLTQISFRAVSKMTIIKKNAATYTTSIAFNLNEWIEQKFILPQPNLLDLRDTSPEEAAIMLRKHWNLGILSIENIIHLLEINGIRVFSINEKNYELDAFSLWKNNTPFIFLNMQKSMERTRFDAAHELGHLILHKHGTPQGGQAIEKEANNFAAAFLIPKETLVSYRPESFNINSLLSMKKKWIVSISALVNRLYKLGRLTDWHYRMLCIHMSRRGYLVKEPEPAKRERSRMLEIIFRKLWKEGISKDHIAEFLSVYPEDIEEIIFGLTGNNSNVSINLRTNVSTKTNDLCRPNIYNIENRN